MTANQIAYQRNVEEQRANRAREAETNRSNVANENIQRDRNAETRRSNLAQETETNRSNLAREAETNRSNLATEYETNRANLAREYETNRSNVANEGLKFAQLRETERSNKASEANQRLSAQAQVMRGQAALNQAAESVRSNMAREKISEDTRKQDRDIASDRHTIAAKQLELDALNSQANIALRQQEANTKSYDSLLRSFSKFTGGNK